MKKTLSLILALAFALALCAAHAEPELELPNVNAFTAKTLYGEDYSQDDLAQYDLTVVNVWSITCGYCVEEMPDLAAFAKALPENVQLIAVCPDAMMAEESVKKFLTEVGFETATLVSAEGDLAALLDNVMYTPTTFFLDSLGNVVGESIIGAPENLSEAYLEAVNAALTGLGKPVIALADA